MEGADADADDVVLLAVEIPKEGRVEEGANAEAVDANARRAMEICIVLMWLVWLVIAVIAVIAVINDCIGWIVCALAICFVLIEHNNTNFNNATT